jgi:tryptophan synthase beta chain
MKYTVDEKGYYGKFGGAYIPEMLYPNVDELRTRYLEIIQEEGFQNEFHYLLKNYVGRPTPLYLASRLSREFKTKIYLKREDLCHTGAHKVNNTIGQILLAKRLGKNHCRDRSGTAWCCHGNGMRTDGNGVHRVHGQSGYGTSAP